MRSAAVLYDYAYEVIEELDKSNADVEALERLASFLGTLFVKHDIAEADAKVLAAVANRRPKLKGTAARCSTVLCRAVLCCTALYMIVGRHFIRI